MPAGSGVSRNGSPPRPQWVLVVFVFLLAGCAVPYSASERPLPPEWRGGRAWGPEANALREQGFLQPRFYTAEMAQWAEWARNNLQSGDLIFRQGTCYRLS